MKIKQKLILSFSTIIAATLVLSAIYSMVLISKISIENIHTTTYRDWETDRKSTRLNSSHITRTRMPSSS